MTDEEYRLIDRQYLEDEILDIIFSYLIKENKKYETVLKQLKHVDWKEKEENDINSSCN